jgi:pimeloyl-ACP methyl ester carboxylesterase
MSNYEDFWYRSRDGLRLYARDYRCRDNTVEHPKTLLCMHGLTRNSADFAGLADHLCRHYRVISVDQRGRGRSEYDSVIANYTPLTYVQDMFTLLDQLDQLDLAELILVGTSLGGLMSLLMSAMQPRRIRAMIINDIGPEVDPRGLERIKSYVGKSTPVSSWDDAVSRAREIAEVAFPDFSDEQWLDFTRGIYREQDGVFTLAYDPAISRSLDDGDSGVVPPDLWAVFEAVTSIPMLLIRGESSDILARSCVDGMRSRKPDLQVAEIPRRGHAPTLIEPASIAAIELFLGQT